MINDYIDLYGKRLYGLCLSLCANQAEAEDLYQDTWLKVVTYISKYDTSKAFEPWLTQICVNTYRNAARRFAKSPFWDRFSSAAEKDSIICNLPAPVAEDHTALHEAISCLPEKLKITVILFYFQDMNIKDTAKALQIPEGTVKSRLAKAKKRLKEALSYEPDISV